MGYDVISHFRKSAQYLTSNNSNASRESHKNRIKIDTCLIYGYVSYNILSSLCGTHFRDNCECSQMYKYIIFHSCKARTEKVTETKTASRSFCSGNTSRRDLASKICKIVLLTEIHSESKEMWIIIKS